MGYDINNIKIGEWYPGIVTNITQFGAFVDLGIKENGLVHISQMADKFVTNPLDILKVGQEVKAKVVEVDPNRKRIALSLKKESEINHEKRLPNTASIKNTKNNKRSFEQTHKKTNAFAGLQGLNLKK